MKIIFFTTDTLHHQYFAQELSKKFPLAAIVVEKNGPTFPFETHHQFEDQREKYESKVFFNNKKVRLSNFAPTYEVESINDQEVSDLITKIEPDVVIVFGTARIKEHIIKGCKNIINLHGGDPEYYRGLDTHLWAIYHNEYYNLITCLHKINPQLDDGDIILRLPLPIKKNMKLYELRRYNAKVCLKLVLTALDMYKKFGQFFTKKQRQRGRYYSAMPKELKEICVKKFENYTAKL